MQSVNTTQSEGGDGPAHDELAESFGEALRDWEPRRLVYNLLLSAVFAGWVAGTWPHFRPALTPYHLLQFAVLGFLANVCYSAGYLAELAWLPLARSAPLPRMRSALWIVGTVLAILFENYWIADEVYPFVR
jgi:hypothetical protein